jgi:capsule biosynthesis phosphatase
MKRIVIDLDGTLCGDELTEAGIPGESVNQVSTPVVRDRYEQLAPIPAILRRLREYKELGFEIIIFTSRNMRTYSNNVGKINANTLPRIIRWLDRHGIPYDEVHVGKPWCGFDGFYVDDKAIRPAEFARLSYDEIRSLLESDRWTTPPEG